MIHLFYTANIRGQLDLLPRIFTHLRALRPADDPHYLIDLGAACDPSAWHCALTGGRSALLVLDAMGYHAALVGSDLTPEARARLADNLLSVALADATTPWHGPHFTLAAEPLAAEPLAVIPGAVTRLDGRQLTLGRVVGGQIGAAQIDPAGPALIAHAIHDLPRSTPPDPTIAAAVDFVLAEARYYGQRQERP